MRRRFVLIRLSGGLGNQMFQYAAARSVALRTRQPLFYDPEAGADTTSDRSAHGASGPSSNGIAEGDGPLALRPFRLAPVCAVDGPLAVTAGLAPWPGRRGSRLFRYLAEKRGVQWVADGKAFGIFLPGILEVHGPVVLQGHFQSARYFDDVATEIRQEFQSAREFGSEFRELTAHMRSGPSVGVHVRRGDYLTTVPKRDLPGDEFFVRSVAAVAAMIGRTPRVFGFSDDAAWLRGRFTQLFPGGIPVSGRLTMNKYEDLFALAACAHQVISPSSFGWWGAWLNPRADKIVITPKRWAWEAHGAADVVPPGWIRL